LQIIGFVLLGFIIWYGFKDRSDAVISAFDAHALVMVLVGSCSAVLVSSSHTTAWRTILCLRELLPGLALFGRTTRAMEVERDQLSALWRDGKRSQAVDLAANSRFPAVKQMLELILNRATEASSNKTFTELRHEEISRWQPAIHNWEMLSKLGPAFGMVGTITGMIQLFRNMSSENLNIGAAMSLALLATLYGVAFGAGVAGPIGHYLNGLLDDRLGLLERCEKSVNEIVSRGER
jgi:flagellar motor component MotA